ncbi:hypothetical protein B5C34_05205 [Pacificimonas flava]|uniref:Uncharacterized protein n=2 Tax=Pacificimonas TaxID=1960290 RepID=A0A219B542_9SPHN|nr:MULTISPECIES: hypothetical protein [Pacificimonas]MBZ6377384.1 hypothetical protein [Pacificimonas aurantium]OWV32909.1 hypothetical protein B5C34_05205 [Pacificimonas flava]
MFVLKREAAVWWPVVWHGASSEEPGAIVENRLDVKFRRRERSDLKRIFGGAYEAASSSKGLDLQFGDPATDRLIFDELVSSWRGLLDEDGRNELPCADPYIGQMIELPGFMAALSLAYMKFAGGIEETRRGNLKGSPAGGPATEPTEAAETTRQTGTTAPERSPNGT